MGAQEDLAGEIVKAFQERAELIRTNVIQGGNHLIEDTIKDISLEIGSKITNSEVEIIPSDYDPKNRSPSTSVYAERFMPFGRATIGIDDPPSSRNYLGNNKRYVRSRLMVPREGFIGTVVGDDRDHNSLVVKRKGILHHFERYWVYPVDLRGEPQVKLRILR